MSNTFGFGGHNTSVIFKKYENIWCFFFHNKEDKELINAINFILGYKTNKPELYKLALLHKSIKTEESNERLEFLGDAILGLIVAKYDCD